MICADSNCWIAYLAGEDGQDVGILDHAVIHGAVVMAPVVLSELLGDPALKPQDEADLCSIRLMDVHPGYWERAGKLRASLLARRLKPRLADTLIAQICIDNDIPLITRDKDFRHFARHGGLRLL
ncbi:MAG: PIN domain-containing protein [Bryobacteraceae bacterium]